MNFLTTESTEHTEKDQVIVEIKSVNILAPIHEAQMLSYLINFNVKVLKEGIRRMRA